LTGSGFSSFLAEALPKIKLDKLDFYLRLGCATFASSICLEELPKGKDSCLDLAGDLLTDIDFLAWIFET